MNINFRSFFIVVLLMLFSSNAYSMDTSQAEQGLWGRITNWITGTQTQTLPAQAQNLKPEQVYIATDGKVFRNENGEIKSYTFDTAVQKLIIGKATPRGIVYDTSKEAIESGYMTELHKKQDQVFSYTMTSRPKIENIDYAKKIVKELGEELGEEVQPEISVEKIEREAQKPTKATPEEIKQRRATVFESMPEMPTEEAKPTVETKPGLTTDDVRALSVEDTDDFTKAKTAFAQEKSTGVSKYKMLRAQQSGFDDPERVWLYPKDKTSSEKLLNISFKDAVNEGMFDENTPMGQDFESFEDAKKAGQAIKDKQNSIRAKIKPGQMLVEEDGTVWSLDDTGKLLREDKDTALYEKKIHKDTPLDKIYDSPKQAFEKGEEIELKKTKFRIPNDQQILYDEESGFIFRNEKGEIKKYTYEDALDNKIIDRNTPAGKYSNTNDALNAGEKIREKKVVPIEKSEFPPDELRKPGETYVNKDGSVWRMDEGGNIERLSHEKAINQGLIKEDTPPGMHYTRQADAQKALDQIGTQEARLEEKLQTKISKAEKAQIQKELDNLAPQKRNLLQQIDDLEQHELMKELEPKLQKEAAARNITTEELIKKEPKAVEEASQNTVVERDLKKPGDLIVDDQGIVHEMQSDGKVKTIAAKDVGLSPETPENKVFANVIDANKEASLVKEAKTHPNEPPKLKKPGQIFVNEDGSFWRMDPPAAPEKIGPINLYTQPEAIEKMGITEFTPRGSYNNLDDLKGITAKAKQIKELPNKISNALKEAPADIIEKITGITKKAQEETKVSNVAKNVKNLIESKLPLKPSDVENLINETKTNISTIKQAASEGSTIFQATRKTATLAEAGKAVKEGIQEQAQAESKVLKVAKGAQQAAEYGKAGLQILKETKVGQAITSAAKTAATATKEALTEGAEATKATLEASGTAGRIAVQVAEKGAEAGKLGAEFGIKGLEFAGDLGRVAMRAATAIGPVIELMSTSGTEVAIEAAFTAADITIAGGLGLETAGLSIVIGIIVEAVFAIITTGVDIAITLGTTVPDMVAQSKGFCYSHAHFLLINEAEGMPNFKVTYRLYSQSFPTNIEYKYAKVGNLALEQRLNSMTSLEQVSSSLNQQDINIAQKSNVLLVRRQKKGEPETDTFVPVQVDTKNPIYKNYIEIKDLQKDEIAKFIWHNRFFSENKPQRIERVEAHFTDPDGKEYVLYKDANWGIQRGGTMQPGYRAYVARLKDDFNENKNQKCYILDVDTRSCKVSPF